MSRIPRKRQNKDGIDHIETSSTFKAPKVSINASNLSSKPANCGIETTNPYVDVQHINKLLDMKNTLSHKKLQPMKVIKAIPDDQLDQDIKLKLQQNRKLCEDIRQLTDKSDNLEVDMAELKRQQKKLYHKLSETKSLIISNDRKFNYLEDSIMSNVSNKEKLVNIKIQDYVEALNAEFDNFKFDLNNELNIAKQFKDDNIENEIKYLHEKRTSLQQKLIIVKQSNNDKLQEAQAKLDEQMSISMGDKIAKCKQLADKYLAKQEAVSRLKLHHDELIVYIQDQNSINSSTNEQISNVKASGDNYDDLKANFLSRINELNSQLFQLKDLEEQETVTYSLQHELNETLTDKIARHNETKTRLENGIMHYRNAWVYINLPKAIPFEYNQFKLNNLKYEFDKVVCKASNSELIKEFLPYCLISLQKSLDMAYIFCGDHCKRLLEDSVYSAYELLASSLTVLSSKAFEEYDNSIHDLFDTSREINLKSFCPKSIPCQTMIIDEAKNLHTILYNLTTTLNAIKVIIVSIKTMDFVSNLVFVDVSQLPIQRQKDTLLLKPDSIGRSIFQYPKYHKLIYLNQGTNKNLLDTLKHLQ